MSGPYDDESDGFEPDYPDSEDDDGWPDYDGDYPEEW